VPIDLVDHLVNNASHFGVMALCRAIGLDWPIVAAILRARLAAGEDEQSDLPELGTQYHQLSAASAQRILRFWQSRASGTKVAARG
jgi:Uncharacterised protein conserved in bacteria (DUF2336)